MSFECYVCGGEFLGTWTDTHGVCICSDCGTPYRVYHYDEDNNRIPDKGPELAVLESWVPLAMSYYDATHRRCFPMSFDMGILGSRTTSYSGASGEDVEAWCDWIDDHKVDYSDLFPENVENTNAKENTA